VDKNQGYFTNGATLQADKNFHFTSSLVLKTAFEMAKCVFKSLVVS